MKNLTALVVAAGALTLADGGAAAQAQWPDAPYSPLPHGGYVCQAPGGWAVLPYSSCRTYPYPYRPHLGWSLPPYGFGSPHYNGHNDPYNYSYGPGVRQFLQMGGANFYGW
jgi:hypothetical protein